MRFSAAFFLCLASNPAFAGGSSATADPASPSYKVSSSTSAGQGNFSETIAATGDHPTGKEDSAGAIDWSGSYIYARTPVGASSNKSSTGEATVGYRKAIDVGGGFSVSSTPAENLTNSGPEAWVGYIFDLDGGSKEEFHPTLEPKFTYKGQNYRQTFGGSTAVRAGSRRTIVRPTTGSEAIRQNEFALGLDVAPAEIISLHLEGARYKYDKDVARFLGLLDSPRAVSSGRASFSDTLGGFPKSSGEIGVTLFPWDTWTIDAAFSRSKLQLDNSTSTGSKIEVSKQISAWKVGLGFDHETSQNQGEENLTLVDLGFTF